SMRAPDTTTLQPRRAGRLPSTRLASWKTMRDFSAMAPPRVRRGSPWRRVRACSERPLELTRDASGDLLERPRLAPPEQAGELHLHDGERRDRHQARVVVAEDPLLDTPSHELRPQFDARLERAARLDLADRPRAPLAQVDAQIVAVAREVGDEGLDC